MEKLLTTRLGPRSTCLESCRQPTNTSGASRQRGTEGRGVRHRRGTGIDPMHEAATLEEMIAERVAQEATRIAEERIK